jgi:hypothetical protein
MAPSHQAPLRKTSFESLLDFGQKMPDLSRFLNVAVLPSVAM